MTTASRPHERRALERRRADRRGRGRSEPDAGRMSWFGAEVDLGTGLDSGEETRAQDDPSTIGAGRPESADRPARADASGPSIARNGRSASAGAFERIYRAFIGARAVIGLMLVLTQAIVSLLGTRSHPVSLAICALYAAQAMVLWLLPRFQRSPRSPPSKLGRRQWAATIGVDVIAFSMLHVLETTSSLNYTALLGLPVLMAGVLTPRLPALATAAAVTLVLLGEAWWSVVSGREATLLMTQTGLAGTGFFVIALLAGELAGRLAREEMTARDSLEFARQQAQLNRLVLEEMQAGVLVVDRRGRVRAANPAARLLIASEGMCRPAPFQLQGVQAWWPLVQAVERAFIDGHWPEAGRDLVLEFAPGVSRTLLVRVRFTRRREREAAEELCVLFVEDLQHVQARVRQEKLAAMGRVSAGIAHEIRNPLAAISQANALLAEDATDPAQRRLMQMVADNVERLKRLVDDVMEVAPGEAIEPGVLDATALVGALCSEWAAAAQLRLGDPCPLHVDLPSEPLGVVFDAEHLRRVLVNLLDNAYRHAGERPGSMRLVLAARDASQAILSVASDSAPIPHDVEVRLFEPFFSTRSRGTGLGLYICRELCERYGARIDFHLRAPQATHRNEFVVVMRRQALATAEHRLHLAP